MNSLPSIDSQPKKKEREARTEQSAGRITTTDRELIGAQFPIQCPYYDSCETQAKFSVTLNICGSFGGSSLVTGASYPNVKLSFFCPSPTTRNTK